MEKFRLEGIDDVTILFVDDEERVIEANVPRLERYGFKTMPCISGREAVEIVREQKIDILLIDYFMPEFTGEDAIKEIRKFNKEIIIILQTAYPGQKPPIEMLQELSIQGYYDKIKDFDELLVLLLAATKTFLQIREIKKLGKQVAAANAMIREVRKNQNCIEEQTRLAVLGQFLQTISMNITCATLNLKDRTAICKEYFEKYVNEQNLEKKDEFRDTLDSLFMSLLESGTYADNFIKNINKKCIPNFADGGHRDYPVKELFEAVEISIKGILKEAGVKIVSIVDESLTIKGDFVALLQTLNILTLKLYAEKLVPSIKILLQAKKEKNKLNISVCNPNVVFDNDQIKEPWKQIISHSGEQISLSTYTAYSVITEYFGGRIWIESSKDNGTTYFIEMPFKPLE